MKRIWLTAIPIIALLVATAGGSIVIDSALSYVYHQNFDTLATSGTGNSWADNSTIVGWWWDSNNSARDPDSYGYIADAGSNTTGAGHSYGAVDEVERAIGALSSSGVDILFGVQFVNNSGGAISLDNIRIGYVGEQWRQNSAAQALVFSYAISGTAIADTRDGSATWSAQTELDFTAPHTGTAGALDGNAAANQEAFSDIALASSGTLNPGEYLMLRWKKSGTSSPGLAVDKFQFEVIPEPAMLSLIGLGLAAARVARRRT